MPTESFKRALVEQRGKPSVRAQTRDPERATENLIGRDLLMARRVEEEAQERGLTVCEVDGFRSLEEMIALVDFAFVPHFEGTPSERVRRPGGLISSVKAVYYEWVRTVEGDERFFDQAGTADLPEGVSL